MKKRRADILSKWKGSFVNVTVENLAPCKKLLRIELDVKAVEDAFESMTKDFQRQVALPGFRPGKAPRDMVAKRYATDIQDEVKKKLIPDAYRQAVKDQKLEVVGYPDIEEIQFGRGQSLQFAATIETAPEFEMPEYKGIAVKRESGKTTDADVERALMLLREREVRFETVARELKEGDVAVVNYVGSCEGKPITDIAPTARGLTEQKNFWINAEKTSFIPGFADQLLGAKAGEKRTVTVDFPGDFVTPQLANKKGAYEVEVVEVKIKVFPEVNEEFAKTYGAESLEKLREGVRTDLQNELDQKQQRAVRNEIVRILLERVNCELPETVVHEETRNVVYNIVMENQKRGVPREMIDQQKQEIFNAANSSAKDRVKANFLFHKIAEKEGIKVEQQALALRVQQMAAASQVAPEKLIKDLEKRNGWPEIYESLLNEKVLDFLVQNARLEETAPVVPATT